MLRRCAVALAVLAGAVAGCLGGEDERDAGDTSRSVAEPPGVNATFEVLSRAGGPLVVDADGWFPDGALVALLGVHGSGGCRPCWGGLGVPGYSFAAHQSLRGRAFVAITLPGYGDSDANDALVTFDDWAFVVDQVADDLRTGEYDVDGAPPRAFTKVVGIGISWGGAVVSLTQGAHASFDAIIPLANSHGGFSPDYVSCQQGGDGCPEDPRSIVFFLPNVDPRIPEAMEAHVEAPPDSALATGVTYYAPWEFFDERLRPLQAAPAPDDVTASITVPVLVIVGREDFFWDQDAIDAEQEHFPNADDFTLARPDATGHVVLLHLNHDELNALIDAWLDERGFSS